MLSHVIMFLSYDQISSLLSSFCFLSFIAPCHLISSTHFFRHLVCSLSFSLSLISFHLISFLFSSFLFFSPLIFSLLFSCHQFLCHLISSVVFSSQLVTCCLIVFSSCLFKFLLFSLPTSCLFSPHPFALDLISFLLILSYLLMTGNAGILAFGALDMHGQERTMMSRLAAGVSAGDTTFEVILIEKIHN